MEIRIIAPGVDCKTSKVNIAQKLACAVIEEIYCNFSHDVMSIHDTNGDFIAEITIRNNWFMIWQSGKCEKSMIHGLVDAEIVVSNIISRYFESMISIN